MMNSSKKSKSKLEDLASITMGQSPSSKTYNTKKEGLPLLNGASDFRNNITPSKWTTDPKKTAEKGSYVFGVRATIGLVTKISHSYAIGRGTSSAIVKNYKNDEFLYFILNDMFEKFNKIESGSVYINISKKDIKEYVFDKPSKEKISSFHNIVQPLMSYIYENRKENLRLKALKNILINELIN